MHCDSTLPSPLWIGIDVAKDNVDFFIFNRKDNPRGRSPRRAAALAEHAR